MEGVQQAEMPGNASRLFASSLVRGSTSAGTVQERKLAGEQVAFPHHAPISPVPVTRLASIRRFRSASMPSSPGLAGWASSCAAACRVLRTLGDR